MVIARGFARLRLAEVAAESGASMGALLHHFPTKNALIVALFDYLYGWRRRRMLAEWRPRVR